MDCFSKLVTAALLLGAGASHAGYAQLAQPAGFGGSPGNWTFAPSANDVRYGSTAFTPNALRVPVPGSAVTMPAAYRFAANAPRIAAGIIFLNPYVRVGVGIASWLSVGKFFWDEVEKQWVKPEYETCQGTTCTVYFYGTVATAVMYGSPSAACNAYMADRASAISSAGGTGPFTVIDGLDCYVKAYFNNKTTPDNASYTQISTKSVPGSSQKFVPVPLPEFEETLSPLPMPPTVPWELPPNTPLPVEPPVVNPDAVPDPQPRPLFVPTGDPVPNPQYDPNSPPGPNNQPYVQPGVRLNPSPTPSEPWRVDLQPVNRPVASPEPMPEPDSETPVNPDKPSEEQLDFCAKNPDVLACQKLDEPAGQELPASEKQISISPDGGWGADNASCPAPKQITVQGRSIPIPFDLFCTWASGMRPIIIAMAWLSAAFILLGARSES